MLFRNKWDKMKVQKNVVIIFMLFFTGNNIFSEKITDYVNKKDVQNVNKIFIYREEKRQKKEELEKEAEQVEKIIEYNPERYREINFEGKKYKLTERKYRELMDEIRKRVEYQLEYNTMGLSDADYLKVLIQYQEMEKRRELIWQK